MATLSTAFNNAGHDTRLTGARRHSHKPRTLGRTCTGRQIFRHELDGIALVRPHSAGQGVVRCHVTMKPCLRRKECERPVDSPNPPHILRTRHWLRGPDDDRDHGAVCHRDERERRHPTPLNQANRALAAVRHSHRLRRFARSVDSPPITFESVRLQDHMPTLLPNDHAATEPSASCPVRQYELLSPASEILTGWAFATAPETQPSGVPLNSVNRSDAMTGKQSSVLRSNHSHLSAGCGTILAEVCA
jgi:hypothetical protein